MVNAKLKAYVIMKRMLYTLVNVVLQNSNGAKTEPAII